ncbi:MAG: glycosyltransferase [Bacteroidia bacterium]|nr:glycosyltransferase [Bacteroidia bacterium]
MADLSVIIVNYNVRHFLWQCLQAVLRASEGLVVEVIVVDNASSDGSVEMLHAWAHPQIRIIANTDNPGFSKANNQGIACATGRHILLLNPDTLVSEDTFRTCVDFMDAHPEAGALGVHMIDGTGRFLPESKRALPTPWVSFYKIFGLSDLFPRNRRFGKYHLTYLDKRQNHQIEVLSGAFMWLRKSLLDQIGGLDEAFFMYGEDIDMSWRVIQAGYQNYYLADTTILHYKGESTQKGSLNYVRVFYQAMIIFARKHFGGRQKQVFIAAIRLAVYFRALLAILRRGVDRAGFMLLEGGLIYAVMYAIQAYWEHYVKYIEGGAYPPEFEQVYMPVYTGVFMLLLWLAGAYRKPYQLRPLILAPLGGFIAIATVTYMFPVVKNFSRAIVGLSAVFTMLVAMTTRGIIHHRERGNFFFTEPSRRRVILVGTPAGVLRLDHLVRRELDYPVEIAGHAVLGAASAYTDLLGQVADLRSLIRLYQADELVFCGETLEAGYMIAEMDRLSDTGVAFKIAPPDAEYLIGPHEVITARDPNYTRSVLSQPEGLRTKRIVDLISASLLLAGFPVMAWAYQRPAAALRALGDVLTGQRHMVGYAGAGERLPRLKAGLLNLTVRIRPPKTPANPDALDALYARSYSWELDLEIILKGWKYIGT